MLQPRQTDNRGEAIISDRGNMPGETRQKLESARKEPFVLVPKLASWSEISCSARKIGSEEDASREDFATTASAVPSHVQAIPDSRSGRSHDESRFREDATNSRDQRDELNHGAMGSRTPFGNAGLWGRDMAGPIQSELRNYELSHRLMLHRLEVCDSQNDYLSQMENGPRDSARTT